MHTLNITIHPATETMASSLAGIHAECFGGEAWSVDQFRGSLMLETSKCWVAMADNIMAGFILCQSVEGENEILTFCVRPNFRRQHIGAQLLRHAVATMISAPMWLEVAADNGAARALYEGIGFQNIAVRRNYYARDGKKIDGISYKLAAKKE